MMFHAKMADVKRAQVKRADAVTVTCRLRAACVFAGSVLVAALLAGCAGQEVRVKPVQLPVIMQKEPWHVAWTRTVGRIDELVDAMPLLPATQDRLVMIKPEEGVVACLDRHSGAVLWETSLSQPLGSALAASDDAAAVVSAAGDVLLLSMSDGKERWRRNVGSEVLAAPAITGDSIFVATSDSRLLRLDLLSGESRWSYEVGQTALSLRGTGAPVVAGDTVIAGFANGKLMGFDIAKGQPLWEVRLSVPTGASDLDRMVDVDGNPVVQGNMVYASGWHGNLAAVSLQTGRPRWQLPMSIRQSAVVSGDVLVVLDAEGVMTAVDVRTGQIAWKQDGLRGRVLLSPVVVDERVMVLEEGGTMHGFDLTSGEWRVRQPLLTQGALSVQVVDKQLYVLSSKGTLRCWQSGPAPAQIESLFYGYGG